MELRNLERPWASMHPLLKWKKVKRIVVLVCVLITPFLLWKVKISSNTFLKIFIIFFPKMVDSKHYTKILYKSQWLIFYNFLYSNFSIIHLFDLYDPKIWETQFLFYYIKFPLGRNLFLSLFLFFFYSRKPNYSPPS